MGWIQSFTCITTCILLLQQQLMVEAVPMNEPRSLIERGSSLHGKFLHITDIHLDPKYLEGADIDSYCHRMKKHKKDKQVGKYGALGSRCDSPTALIQATFDFLKKEVKDIDFILYTGDTVRHDRDDDLPFSKNDILNGHKSVMKYFRSAYDIKSTPYIPTIGNNDGFNHNDVGKNDKIFSTLKSIWKPLDLNLTSTFTAGGYYVQDVVPNKLSIINLNSMYFFEKNDEVSDCGSSSSAAAIQMKWLEKNLKQYQKKKNHQVYIMGHVPPIDDDGSALYKSECYSQYLTLLGKYGSVISGHFTGHTNNDNLNAVIPKSSKKFTFMAADDGDARAVKSSLIQTQVGLFNAPSVIPVNNPGLRVYRYETEGKDYPFGTIRDWDQYYVDLEKANKQRKLKYELEYKASQLYKVDSFDGAGIGRAITYVSNNKQARKLYKKYAGVST